MVIAVLGVLDLGVDDVEELGIEAGPRRGRQRERHPGEGPEQSGAALGPQGGGGAEDRGEAKSKNTLVHSFFMSIVIL